MLLASLCCLWWSGAAETLPCCAAMHTPPAVWALSSKAHNRSMHALNGNNSVRCAALEHERDSVGAEVTVAAKETDGIHSCNAAIDGSTYADANYSQRIRMRSFSKSKVSTLVVFFFGLVLPGHCLSVATPAPALLGSPLPLCPHLSCGQPRRLLKPDTSKATEEVPMHVIPAWQRFSPLMHAHAHVRAACVSRPKRHLK